MVASLTPVLFHILTAISPKFQKKINLNLTLSVGLVQAITTLLYCVFQLKTRDYVISQNLSIQDRGGSGLRLLVCLTILTIHLQSHQV